MRKTFPVLVLLAGLILGTITASAQEESETLVLDFNRDFGYGGFGGDIQGRFSLKVTGPDDIVRVVYYLDGDQVYEGTEPPFRWKFNTASYPEGRHTFSAVGYKADGIEVTAADFSRVFLSPERAWGKTGDIVIPLLVLVGIITVAGVLGPVLLGRKKIHAPGVYGAAGGAICPRCTFPYSRHILAPNMVVGKLERCPHCGKWAIVPRAAAEVLEAAEARLAAADGGTVNGPGEEDALRRMIEDSRFEE